MPELPEIETIRLSLAPNIIGKKIASISQFRDNLRYSIPKELGSICVNQTILSVTRRAKYLILSLENNYNIIIHLGMSGRFTLNKNLAIKKHDHLIFSLEGENQLVLNDPRRFGFVDIIAKNHIDHHKYFARLGIEPLTEKFDTAYLMPRLAQKKVAIKNLIMDSSIVVGVGNIYASESLYLAKIHPLKSAGSLTEYEVGKLVTAIKSVLNRAIIAGGSTLKDFVSGNGESGYFQNQFNVYSKAGEMCPACLSAIERIVQAGRSTFFCSTCQE